MIMQLDQKTFNKRILDTDNSNAVYEGVDIAVVDFYADWCSPCKILSPILEEIAKENIGVVSVYKVDVDEHQSLAMKFGVRSIPTVLYFKPGSRTPKITMGAMPKSMILEIIEELKPE